MHPLNPAAWLLFALAWAAIATAPSWRPLGRAACAVMAALALLGFLAAL